MFDHTVCRLLSAVTIRRSLSMLPPSPVEPTKPDVTPCWCSARVRPYYVELYSFSFAERSCSTFCSVLEWCNLELYNGSAFKVAHVCKVYLSMYIHTDMQHQDEFTENLVITRHFCTVVLSANQEIYTQITCNCTSPIGFTIANEAPFLGSDSSLIVSRLRNLVTEAVR
jgi:hypothetical protein